MTRFSGNQFGDYMGRAMQANYGPGPTTAGTTTVNAPALPSITCVPNETARDGHLRSTMRQTDGKQIPGYHNPDAIMVGQGTNHRGNQ
jgi:hypothetical protein